MVVSTRWFEFSSQFPHPILTLSLPLFYLKFPHHNPAQPAIMNHGLETTVDRPLFCQRKIAAPHYESSSLRIVKGTLCQDLIGLGRTEPFLSEARKTTSTRSSSRKVPPECFTRKPSCDYILGFHTANA